MPSNPSPGILDRVGSFFKGMFGGGNAQAPPNQDPELQAQLKAFDFGYADEAIAYVEKEYTRRLNEHRPWHLLWRLIISFVGGDQYCDINTSSGSIEEIPKLYWWQERKVYNQIGPINDVRVSKLTRARPLLKARPASNEQRDIGGAKVATRVLAANEHDQDWAGKYSEAVAWMEQTGTVITKDTWNPRKGKLLGYMETQTTAGALPDPENKNRDSQETVTERAEVREGDAETVIRSPFTIFPDSPWHSDVSECKSIVEAQAFSVDDIYMQWGVRVDPENIITMGMQAAGVLSGLDSGSNRYRMGAISLQGHAVVKELWERPSPRFPQGRYIVVANKKLLYIGPLPYRIGQDQAYDLPYTFWWSIRRPGCMWGRTVLERILDPQRQYNALRNRKTDYLNRVAIGQMSVEEGAVDLDDEEANGTSPGYIHVVKKGYNAPQPVQWPSLPASFEQEEQTLLQEITILSGVSELSRQSVAPPGVKSGVALSIAMEQDDTRLAQTIANIERASVESGKKRLRLYKQFAVGPRISRYVGRNDEIDALYWDASQITSEDLFVENTTALAESPAQRRQMVFDLMGTGLYSDPATGRLTKEGQRKVLEMLQLGDWEDGSDVDDLQASKQDREIVAMLNGALPEVADIDDDLIHLERLTRYMLGADYEERILQQDGQAVAQRFIAHRQMHLQRLAQQAMNQMQQQQMMQTQPGGGQVAAS